MGKTCLFPAIPVLLGVVFDGDRYLAVAVGKKAIKLRGVGFLIPLYRDLFHRPRFGGQCRARQGQTEGQCQGKRFPPAESFFHPVFPHLKSEEPRGGTGKLPRGVFLRFLKFMLLSFH